DDRALRDAEVPGRHPASSLHREGRVEGGLEAVRLKHAQVHLAELLDGRQHDLRSERQGGDHGPRGDGAVVGAVGRAAGNVVEEAALDAVDEAYRRAGTVARREAPAEFAVAGELQGV